MSLMKEKIKWATTPFHNGLVGDVIVKVGQTKWEARLHANIAEKIWGNKMIGQTNNNQWTTQLGESLVSDILSGKGETVSKPKKKNRYLPDLETETAIWEVKTRNWTTSGTAGEKVFGTMYKYCDIPILYGKPLKIVCVAYQEWELTNGNTKIFGEIGERQLRFIKLAKDMNIEYIPFSMLLD